MVRPVAPLMSSLCIQVSRVKMVSTRRLVQLVALELVRPGGNRVQLAVQRGFDPDLGQGLPNTFWKQSTDPNAHQLPSKIVVNLNVNANDLDKPADGIAPRCGIPTRPRSTCR
jgi:hypothetical protein